MAIFFLSCLLVTLLSTCQGFAVKSKKELVCDFEEYKGYALYGYNDNTVYDTTLDDCKAACVKDGHNCLSFDYKSNTDSCFMSTKSKDTNPEAYGKHSRSSYYHKVCTDVVVTTTASTTTTTTTTTPPPIEEHSGDDFSGSGSGDDYEIEPEVVEPEEDCIIPYGYFGGVGGKSFSDKDKISTHGEIDGIIVTAGWLVHCVGMIRGDERTCYGGNGDTEYVEMLEEGEYITTVVGREGDVIDQIGFLTNTGRVFGPYGGTGGTAFEVETGGKKLAYITGKSGELVDQITFHFYC